MYYVAIANVQNICDVNGWEEYKGMYYVAIANVQNIYNVNGWEEYNIGCYVLLVPMLYTLRKKQELHLISVVRKTNLLMTYK